MTKPHESDAAQLLDDLLRRGFAVHAEGLALFVIPTERLTAGDRIAVRSCKAALITLLSQDGTGSDIRITLRPLSATVPASVRIRRALKTLLRSFSLRCTRVEDVVPALPTSATARPSDQPEPRGNHD